MHVLLDVDAAILAELYSNPQPLSKSEIDESLGRGAGVFDSRQKFLEARGLVNIEGDIVDLTNEAIRQMHQRTTVE